MNPRSVQKSREKNLRASLEEEGLRGAVIVPGPNMKYLTGVDSLMLERPFMLLVPTDGEAHLIAPTLEAGPYRESAPGLEMHEWTDSEGPEGAIAEAAKGAGANGRWGIEGRVPFIYLDRLMKQADIEPEDAEPVLQRLREVKDETEVSLLKKSSSILSRAFDEIPELLREGITEAELAKEATELIYAKGASKVDDMLVQAGASGADPHHLPSGKKISRGESIVIDTGSTFKGYYSDITRTFCVGSSPEVEKVYSRVLEAQSSAIEVSAVGVRVGAVDGAARKTLAKAGMEKYFFTRTGHGLGLEIHEAPYIVEDGREKLGKNMCFTVEPGVYIRGRMGVRIEDDLLIDGKVGRALTDTPKEYGWWK